MKVEDSLDIVEAQINETKSVIKILMEGRNKCRIDLTFRQVISVNEVISQKCEE